jgi:hypothetical protein
MGWTCLSDACRVSGGVWNDKGLAYFSISDEVLQIHDASIHFLVSVTPFTYAIVFTLSFIIFLAVMFTSVQKRIKKLGVN